MLSSCRLYTLCPKNVPLCDCLYLRQILTDFQNSYTDAFCWQLGKWLLNIPRHVNCVATLTCEIHVYMQEELTLIDSKRVGKQNTLPTKNHWKMQWMICMMLHFVRSFPLGIWRIEQYVYFWPLWFSKPTISPTVITFSSVCVCFSLPVSCLWSVQYVFKISLNNNFCMKLSKKLFHKMIFCICVIVILVIFENVCFTW